MMGRYSGHFLRTKRILGPSIATAALFSTSSALIIASSTSALIVSPSSSLLHPVFPSRRIPHSRQQLYLTGSNTNAKNDVTASEPSNGITEDDDSGDDCWNDILPLEKGSHGSAKISIPIETTGESNDFEEGSFRQKLKATVTACRELGKSSVWVEVPMIRSSLIELGDMYDQGFRFHHAVHDKSVLNLWLRGEEHESKIPEFSTHNVGVGAVVINSRDEILLVRELRKNYMPWKTPTGLSELGEHIDEAVEREVLEETGIKAKFNSIIGFRQTHGMAHGRSDLFFVCKLDPIEEKDEHGNAIIPDPVAQADEIERAEWVPLSEYRAMVHGDDGQPGHPMMSHVIDVLDAGKHIQRKVVQSVIPGRKPNAIFYPVAGPKDPSNES